MPETDNREESLLRHARERPPAERAAFLDRACAGDDGLRRRLEAQLAAQKQSESQAATEPEVLRPTIKVEFPDERPDESVGQTLGRYKLLEKIGEGGCGVVYVAEQTEPVHRRVALKVIKLGMDTRAVVARFEAERQALAIMDHPNIAKVLDAGATDLGRPYFVLELVRGIRITEYCDQAQLSTRERVELFIKVCQAIQHAHQKGVIHRDIKPSNILVTLHDEVPVPKVIDFGIAKATQGSLTDATVYTQLHQFIGTPAYMSPEQAQMSGLDIDTRSDIYSLGVVLYELVVGSTPFDPKELVASGIDAMRKTIREKEPVRPSTRIAGLENDELTATARRRSVDKSRLVALLRGDLDWIVMKCLEKNRTRRYDTANGLAMDLKRYLANEPVLARPPSAAYRFQKAIRRNKLVFAAGAASATALLVGISASLWQAARATKAKIEADAASRMARVSEQKALLAEAGQSRLRERAEILEMATRRRAYASDMNLAQQSIALNNFGRAHELLNRHRSATKSEIDLRGWEWRYLWQFCQSDALFTLCRETNSAFSLALSPDGRWVAVGEYEHGGLSIWDLRTRREVARPGAGNVNEVRAAFSPRAPLLAFAETLADSKGVQERVQLWNAATERAMGALPLEGHCLGLNFAEDGNSLAAFVSGAVPALTIWSVPEDARHTTVPLEGMITRGRFSTTPDLRLAAYALGEGRIRVMDLVTGKERWSAKAADERAIALTFSPDGKVLASSAGFAEGAIRLWAVSTGQELARLEGHRAWVSSLVFWPDGKRLASASADQTIRLWDIADPGKASSVAVLRGHNCEVWSLALLPDGATLLSGGKDGTVRLWDSTKQQRQEAFCTLPAKVRDWTFTADSKSLIVVAANGQVARWTGDAFQKAQLVTEIDPAAPSVVLSRDGRHLAGGSHNGIVKVWDLERGTPPRELSVQEGEANGAALPLVFLAQGERLIIARANGILQDWDLSTGRKTNSWKSADATTAFTISPDERRCATFGFGGASILRELPGLAQTNLGVNLLQANAASFSPDGKLFAVVGALGIGKLWSVDAPRELGTLRGFLLGMHSVAFSPDGIRLAIGGNGKEAVKLLDVTSCQELLTLEAEGSSYIKTEFSPDGNILASMNAQGLLRLWRAPAWTEIEAAEAVP